MPERVTARPGTALLRLRLAMIADTMIPEAFDDAHLVIGLITVSGFLVSFALSHA
ncbi:hypothetical protein QFZ66_008112 [Streptomyces sp. B4I13]|nr:hypothetical protein [Streptomyces sp. B4I13]